mmetsp:Transcript_1345/g.3904  ORF Transcript_1345/g.3904 Transcript_1345/m.3904 type:complete len:256 (-) Transcript_1345:1085-1852(-)
MTRGVAGALLWLLWYLALSWMAMFRPSPMAMLVFCFFFGFDVDVAVVSRPVNFGWRFAGIQLNGARWPYCFSRARIKSTLAWSAVLYVTLNFAHADTSSSFFAALIWLTSFLKNASLRPASEFAAPPTHCKSPEVRRAALAFSSGPASPSSSSSSSFPRPNVGSFSASQLTSDDSAVSVAAAIRRFFVFSSAASCFQYGAAVNGYRPDLFQAFALFSGLNATGHDLLRHSRTSPKSRDREPYLMRFSTSFSCLSR